MGDPIHPRSARAWQRATGTMERGGTSLRSHLRCSVPCCAALPRSPSPRTARRPARAQSPASISNPPRPRLAHHLRSCICLKEQEYLFMHKALQKYRIARRAFSSCGPQGASLHSDEIRRSKVLIDCGTDQECVVGGIVALGKFDALHIGHRELAIQASKAGIPFLLSFVGMAEVLGWDSRPPIVAKLDRKRVLSSWAPNCGNVVPLEYEVEFSRVRHLTPRQFVERLSKEFKVSGVVAGENYRFGYRASGDALELVRLCKEYGLDAFIVNSVMDKTGRSYNGSTMGINSSDRGQVSSTRVRQALAIGDMEYVAELLGRKHRLLLMINERCLCSDDRILAPNHCMFNQPPGNGVYESCTLLVDDEFVGTCRVLIDAENIDIELEGRNFWIPETSTVGRLIGLEFG